MPRLLRTSLWLLAGFACVAQAQDTRPRANDEVLRHALDGVRLRHDVPGMSAVIFDREDVRLIAVGERGEEAGPVDVDTPFRIGQLGMLFTGMAVAVLQAEESLSADIELHRAAPEIDVQNPWRADRAVTLDDLLLHRAGLGALRFRDVHVDTVEQPLLAAINRAWRELRLQHAPGEREHYSIVGYAIAAYLVEKSVSMPYENVLERMLFVPLELQQRGVETEPPARSHGHAGRTMRAVDAPPLNFSFSDGWFSARDLGVVGQLLLNRGRHGERQLLPESAVDWMESSSLAHPPVPGARRGVHAEELGGFLFHTQTGAPPGFLARFAYSPELGKGYAVLLNRGDANAALGEAERLLRGQVVASERPLPPSAAIELPDDLSGWYRSVRHESPPRHLYQRWLEFAYAWPCESRLCVQGVGRPRLVLEAIGDGMLRERGRRHAGWRLVGEEILQLEHAHASWQRTASVLVAGMLFMAIFSIVGVLAGAAMLPAWMVAMIRDRNFDYHALAPRMLPVAAASSVIAGQAVLFSAGYPALGQPGIVGVSILALTIAPPVLSLLAIAAAIAGFFWRQPKPDMTLALTIALASASASIMLADAGLIAFRPWMY